MPHYKCPESELNRAIKTTAVARLAASGLDTTAVGGQCYATLIAVTGRARQTINAAQHEALDAATRALGWRANEVTLLCCPELPRALDAVVVLAYAQALNAEAVILLERNLLAEAPQVPWLKCAVCDDFFGSLGDDEKKRVAWRQMQAARRNPALTE